VNKPDLDELLAGSRPAFAPKIATEAALDALVFETKNAGGRTRTRRALWLVPAAALAAGALTAGAVVVDQYTRIDVPVAIEYTTDTGVHVECTANIEGGNFFSPQPAAVINRYKTYNFTGVGQRIYDYAVVLTGDEVGTSAVLPDSSEWLPDASFPGYSEELALSHSMGSFLLLDPAIELNLNGNTEAELTSDCAGLLH